MNAKNESLGSQVHRLARFITENCEGYPNVNEGAVDCAIRIIKAYATQSLPSQIIDEEIQVEAMMQNPFNVKYSKYRREGFTKGVKWAINRTALPREGESEKPICTSPDCDCIEQAEKTNDGQGVKSYPCLMSGAIKKWAIENGEY